MLLTCADEEDEQIIASQIAADAEKRRATALSDTDTDDVTHLAIDSGKWKSHMEDNAVNDLAI